MKLLESKLKTTTKLSVKQSIPSVLFKHRNPIVIWSKLTSQNKSIQPVVATTL